MLPTCHRPNVAAEIRPRVVDAMDVVAKLLDEVQTARVGAVLIAVARVARVAVSPEPVLTMVAAATGVIRTYWNVIAG